MGKYGTNLEGFGAFEGGVNADKGAPLVSTSSDGEKALLFGPAALREIQAGVANGDFAIPPDAAGDTITEENPLPYWTFTDVNSAGAITAAIVASASAGSGNILRWSVAASTLTGKSATLTRFVAVGASQNRAFAYIPELNTFGATATTAISLTLTYQYYKQDYTTTGSSGTATATFTTLGTGINWFNPPLATTNAAPSDAAFIYIEIKVSTTGTTPASISTVDITEARVIRGDQTSLFAEYTTPGTYSPTRVRQVNGVLNIEPDGGTGNVTLGGDLTVSGNDINLGTGFTISGVGTSAVQFTRNDSGNRANITVGRVFPGTQTTRYIDDDGTRTTVSSHLMADRIYPGSQTTRYIDDDGSRTSFSGGIDVNAASTMTSAVLSSSLTASSVFATSSSTAFFGYNGGDVELTGTDTTVPISGNGELTAIPNTTTATTNSARWVLISGSEYGLRRDSSTRRVKTNIVEADDAVLAAAKNLRAVHYEALEKDAEGNLVPSGQHTLGLIAEEIVDAGLGCAVTYDGEGLPDGYDERVIIAALLHRVNDLEARLKALESR